MSWSRLRFGTKAPVVWHPRKPCPAHVPHVGDGGKSRLGQRQRRRLPREATSAQAVKALAVREAVLADLDALEAIEDGSRPGGNWNRREMEAEVVRERATVLVAESSDQQTVGLVVAWSVPPDELHVLELAVLPEFRRQGIARQLMQHLIEKHRAQAQTVLLEVRKGNLGAQQLYEQLGFVVVGVRRKYYKNGEDALLMNLEIV